MEVQTKEICCQDNGKAGGKASAKRVPRRQWGTNTRLFAYNNSNNTGARTHTKR